MFHIGQRVVCIDNTCSWGIPEYVKKILWPSVPEVGAIYTIRGIFEIQEPCIEGSYFLLEEIHNPEHVWKPPYGKREGGFASWKFRPVVDRTTDISVFKKMLVPQEEKV